ncbi:MAG: hypothetical protein EA341_14070 [Mongoliibacter sp.]|uniref:DUF6600 domain-containing protein n=1 Tax=Mongoliibacter sp. TaxID=2022438 RepID=UPI0012F28198|nr:DUF6600 domain-containing protein [Mongoliibacter sp.]TVP46094.1 MAG: hypothetical protein EA341_14070 [Mongoliibacter sp.]
MKTTILYRMCMVLMLGIGIALMNRAHASHHYNGSVSFQVFYNELAPYGDWVMDPNHGYVWVPYVDNNFQPYVTNGYWTMTNFGNTWVSNYNWGWAPFHYGRWFWDDLYGWAWVPGYEWGPAWVSWRTGGGYYGWAPLGPGMHVNIGIYMPARHWVFLPQRRFRARYFHRYFIPSYNVVNVYNNTTIINNTYVNNNTTYYTGPSGNELQRTTRSNIPVYQVNETSRPGRATLNNNSLNVYRPQIASSRSANEAARPQRAIKAEEFKRSDARSRVNSANSGNQNTQGVRSAGSATRANSQAARTQTGQQPQNRTAAPDARNNSRNATLGNTNSRDNQNINTPGTRSSTRVQSGTNQRTESPSVNSRNSRPQNNTAVRSGSNNRSSSPAVRSGTSNRQSSPTVRSGSSSRQSSPAVRSSAPSRQSSPSVRSAPSRSSSSGTSSRQSSSRGGRGNN